MNEEPRTTPGAARGPAFLPAPPSVGPGSAYSDQPYAGQQPLGQAAAGRPAPPKPPGYRPSRRPTVITIVVIAVVAAVVLGATLFARYADTHVAAPPAPTVPAPAPQPDDRIDFTTDDGTGQLIVHSHAWVSNARMRPTSGSYLLVEVEIRCATGQVDADPYNFQVFDVSGNAFPLAPEGAGTRLLTAETLRPGESARGVLAFDLARTKPVTLLMTDGADRTVTAIQVLRR